MLSERGVDTLFLVRMPGMFFGFGGYGSGVSDGSVQQCGAFLNLEEMEGKYARVSKVKG